jgi:tripartite-type tricarboxylate transporter receptor subunit TctC
MTSHSVRPASILVTAFVACLMFTWPAQAQTAYPNQTIRIIVPYPPAGLPDTVARIVARGLQERLGQAVIVENRPGANGNIAATTLANSMPDGYTFILSDGAILSINPQLYAKRSYQPQDIVPVAFLARAPLFLAVGSKLPVQTMAEFIAHAEGHPGKVNYGTAGVGSIHHLSMEIVKTSLGINMTHIPFKGTAESVTALLGGHVDAVFAAYPALSATGAGERAKLLATTSLDRSPQAPEVPPLSELIPGFDFAPIVGIFTRAGVPQPIIQQIAAEAAAIVKEPDAIRRLMAVGVEPVGGGPDEFGNALKNQSERVGRAIAVAKIELQ